MPVDATIKIYFDRFIQVNSANIGKLSLKPYTGTNQYGPALEVDTTLMIDQTTLSIKPKMGMAYGTKYRVTIPNDTVESLDLACSPNDLYEFTFTTVPDYDVNADGHLDISDLLWAASRLGSAADIEAKKVDFNNDNKVDIKDLIVLNQNITR